jgi:fatty acid kinase fatty acid binding subunit
VPYAGAVAGVAMVTDSTSSLSPRHAERDGIVIVPLRVIVDGISRPEALPGLPAGPDTVTPGDVARAMRAGRSVSTSRPGPDAFVAAYRRLADSGYDAVVSAHLSRAVSGTVDAAALAAPDSPIPVSVVDTGTAGMATGFAVLAGAAAARSGASAEGVAETVERCAAAATTYFCVADLEPLRRGGRIGAAAALVGSALAVKPLLTVDNGSIRPYERVRTTTRAHARLGELARVALSEATERYARVDVAVHHLDAPAAAERIADELRGRVPPPGEVVIAELSAVLGVHVGPGTLGVVISPRV